MASYSFPATVTYIIFHVPKYLAGALPRMWAPRWWSIQQVFPFLYRSSYVTPYFGVVVGQVMSQAILGEMVVLGNLPFLPVIQFVLVFSQVFETEACFVDAPCESCSRSR